MLCISARQSLHSLPDPGNIGIGAFELWPTARSTALAGAITGLADEADATYFNPAGLAFQTTARANLDCGKWLPGVPPGMDYIGAAGGVPLRLQPGICSHHAYVSGDIVYMTTGGGGHGYLWRGYAAAQMAILLTSGLGAGIGLKVAHNTYSVTWAEREFEEGTAEAANLAVLYRPRSYISIGAAWTIWALALFTIPAATSQSCLDWLDWGFAGPRSTRGMHGFESCRNWTSYWSACSRTPRPRAWVMNGGTSGRQSGLRRPRTTWCRFD